MEVDLARGGLEELIRSIDLELKNRG